MANELIIEQAVEFVQQELKGAEGGHDWWHIQRVWTNTVSILEEEPQADRLVCILAALLHDIADSKFHEGDERIGPAKAEEFLSQKTNLDPERIQHVLNIIKHMSFSKSFDLLDFSSLEMKIVQDADRLDALGAIGIARAFNFGGFKNREMYNPHIPPNMNMDKDTYKKRNSPTINHFHEKLLLLKDLMNTEKGKKLALERHQFMLQFLEQFEREMQA